MKCIDPTLCYEVNGKRLFRSWSVITKFQPIIFRGKDPDLVFDCGKCLICRKKRAVELAARCVLHASMYKHNMFLTLTYDESREGYHNDFDYRDIQLFKKRLRSFVTRRMGTRMDIFNVHEYGKRGKKHWHLLVFNFAFQDKEIHTYKNQIPLYTSKDLATLWPMGYSTIGDVSEASAMYQAMYMEKDFRNAHAGTEKSSSSNHSGLGKPYFLAHFRQLLSLGYVPFGSRKLPVPRYFQKLAERHWAHFNEPSWFFDNWERKAKYRPFTNEQPSRDIASYYSLFLSLKRDKILELELEFEEVINTYLSTGIDPDFVLSGSNINYDLRNRSSLERF